VLLFIVRRLVYKIHFVSCTICVASKFEYMNLLRSNFCVNCISERDVCLSLTHVSSTCCLTADVLCFFQFISNYCQYIGYFNIPLGCRTKILQRIPVLSEIATSEPGYCYARSPSLCTLTFRDPLGELPSVEGRASTSMT